MRHQRVSKASIHNFENWTPQHDSYLIENNHLDMDVLTRNLPFNAEEIMGRRKVLGLVTRSKQMKKLRHL